MTTAILLSTKRVSTVQNGRDLAGIVGAFGCHRTGNTGFCGSGTVTCSSPEAQRERAARRDWLRHRSGEWSQLQAIDCTPYLHLSPVISKDWQQRQGPRFNNHVAFAHYPVVDAPLLMPSLDQSGSQHHHYDIMVSASHRSCALTLCKGAGVYKDLEIQYMMMFVCP